MFEIMPHDEFHNIYYVSCSIQVSDMEIMCYIHVYIYIYIYIYIYPPAPACQGHTAAEIEN